MKSAKMYGTITNRLLLRKSIPPAAGSCCGAPSDADSLSSQMGYSTEELTAVPQGTNLGLGYGNPQAIAELKAGEVVLDLGSGGGFDCFLASAA